MSLNSKVVWSEGMFLNPQHFQQQDRYHESFVDGKCSAFGAYGWGVHEFEIDQQLLSLGKVSVSSSKGVFPDGTPFNFPDYDDPPPVLEVPENTHNSTLYLCVPVKRQGAVEVISDESSQSLARYYESEQEIRDISADSGDTVTVNVGRLNLRLLLETDDLSGYVCIGLIRIAESRDDKNVLLDEGFIASYLDCNKSTYFSGFLSELIGLLHHRGEAIGSRLADSRQAGTAEVADYMMLQLINRTEPLVKHMAGVNGLHPINLYALLVQLVGELATFVAKNKRAPEFPQYLHADLQASFSPVISALRDTLSAVYEQSAISLELVEKKYGIRVAQISDKTLIDSAFFVLSAKAEMPEESLRSRLPAQVKIGPVERIRQLVNSAMPGIVLKPLPVVPRQIPYHSGFAYFQLEQQSEFWKELKSSGGFAIHVGGEFPDLVLELWAVRR